MHRIPEPELMDDKDQATAYANADFEEPHNHFIELLKEFIGNDFPDSGTAMDLGCGAADISIRFAKAFPYCQIDALDGSEAMLNEGRKAIGLARLNERINLLHALLSDVTLKNKNYSIIFSNSLLHHLHDPLILWNAIKNADGKPKIFIMDLMRPENAERVDYFVETYASDEPEILQRDFRNSLKAAFTPEEVKLQLKESGLSNMIVKAVSDRHLIIFNQK